MGTKLWVHVCTAPPASVFCLVGLLAPPARFGEGGMGFQHMKENLFLIIRSDESLFRQEVMREECLTVGRRETAQMASCCRATCCCAGNRQQRHTDTPGIRPRTGSPALAPALGFGQPCRGLGDQTAMLRLEMGFHCVLGAQVLTCSLLYSLWPAQGC